MGSTLFNAVLVTERPFMGRYYGIDGDGNWRVRHYTARTVCDSKHIFCERIALASGVPVLWRHGWGKSFAVGMVRTMSFQTRKLVGEIEIDNANIEAIAPGGTPALARGVNGGLSAGFDFLDDGGYKMTKRGGTLADPDKIVYGRLMMVEMSLTPLPRIADCGITGMVNMSNDDDEEGPDGAESQ